jgi:hypothetical protein
MSVCSPSLVARDPSPLRSPAPHHPLNHPHLLFAVQSSPPTFAHPPPAARNTQSSTMYERGSQVMSVHPSILPRCLGKIVGIFQLFDVVLWKDAPHRLHGWTLICCYPLSYLVLARLARSSASALQGCFTNRNIYEIYSG